MSLLFSEKILNYDASMAFGVMSKYIQKAISNGKPIDEKRLIYSLNALEDCFESKGQKFIMNYKSSGLAQRLSEKKEYSLSSIIFSFLIKHNISNPVLYEDFARRALKNAKNTTDVIHIMARANDLNQLYRHTQYGSPRHLMTLKEERDALVKIISNYKEAVKNYKTITRKPLSPSHYEFMLCGVRMEIAKIIGEKYPLQAIQELEKAQNMMKKYGGGTLTSRITQMIDNLYANL